MSNISVKKHGSDLPAATPSPLRMMRRLLGWDPFQQMTPFFPSDEPALTFAPAFEVKETKDAYEFRGDLPGVEEEDIEVTVTGNRLTISGERDAETEESTGRYFATERLYGSFVRTFTLPEGIDPEGVSASLVSGVLHVTVPKKAESQPRKIALKTHEVEAKSTETEAEGKAEGKTDEPEADQAVTQAEEEASAQPT